jgi:hypothetical protein
MREHLMPAKWKWTIESLPAAGTDGVLIVPNIRTIKLKSNGDVPVKKQELPKGRNFTTKAQRH